MNNKAALPVAENWNRYWSLGQTKRFTKVSWSKRRIMNVLVPYLKKNGRALDAGCGSGFFSNYFSQQGMKTTALDYSSEALALARRQSGNRIEAAQKDLLNDDLASAFGQSFDLIFSDGLLEHFSSLDQDKIMRNLLKVLAPGGILVTFVPNRWSPWELIRPLYMPGIEEKPFVLADLIALNNRNGFKVREQGGVNTFPFALSPDRLVGRLFGMLLYTVAQKS